MQIATLTRPRYKLLQTWHEFYENGHRLEDITYCSTWAFLFARLKKDPNFRKTCDKLKKTCKNNPHIQIFPPPSLLFASFTITPADNLKVVILGQDPYPTPGHAMGLSFSAPHGEEIPASLVNVYKNLIKFRHIKEMPKSPNLWYWSVQGCLLLNTVLTVEGGKIKSHSTYWPWMTDQQIRYMSENMESLVFLLWGSDAISKRSLIDTNRHTIIQSTHPSPQAAHTSTARAEAFMNVDHFGEANKQLRLLGKQEIMWD